jgi:Trk K+ transport system NAD-binding subunit
MVDGAGWLSQKLIIFVRYPMKSLSTQLSFLFQNKEIKQNLPLLFKIFGILLAMLLVYTVIFHLIMVYAEGENHSWVTGLYWTLTVMSTLGFGDITFQTDIGRIFSIVVLITGIIMVLIVLPFAFIRFFYAPYLEEQIRMRAPRSLPEDTENHVIICSHNSMTQPLISRLERDNIDYVLIEPDPAAAASWISEGIKTVVGEVDNKETYANIQAARASLILANRDDMMNTNITLTVREVAPDVPIAAISSDENASDILELSGSTHVLPLKQWLGEQLANRVNAQGADLHMIGEYETLKIAELSVQNTPFCGKTVRETRLREETGISIIGVWDRGPLSAAQPNKLLGESSVPVLMGTESQFEELDALLKSGGEDNVHGVLLIGGGTVGAAAARALAAKNVPVHLVERDPARCKKLESVCANVFQGDAADYDLLTEAGIAEAPAVLLTTNDDAVNVYLTAYCRRLNPKLRIVSRITFERNLEAMYRAGADFVLSYSTLGIDAISSIIKGKELIVLGEGVDIFARKLPPSLEGKTLAVSGIGAMTGLNVVALQHGEELVTNLLPTTELEHDMKLLLVGSDEQVQRFSEIYG